MKSKMVNTPGLQILRENKKVDRSSYKPTMLNRNMSATIVMEDPTICNNR